MNSKAFAPEYQGELRTVLGVNSSYEEVLTKATKARRGAGSSLEQARASLAVAEAYRRLGRVEEAGEAWRESYRGARRTGEKGAMAWALWSGGTLARQCGTLPLARRLLSHALDLAEESGDRVAHGYCLAGLAETGRIQGDYAAVGGLHVELLAQARAHGEPRHIVWALSGIAQMHRNTGALDEALEMFEESVRTAAAGDDARGHAWSMRGVADVLSAQGHPERALELLTEAEVICRRMDLKSALAYNHKMRGNVLYRAGRYESARSVYAGALAEFRAMNEPRGAVLSRLGLVRAQHFLGASDAATLGELDALEREVARIGLRHAAETIRAFRARVEAPERAAEPARP
jgi:tetratricopeptide (TPR) repeat protein